MAIMDWRVTQAIVENDTVSFKNMVEQDEQVLDKKIGNTSVLHLASKTGHVEMVSLILELRPKMVAAENCNSETPIHEACRMGHEMVVRRLMEENKWVASKLNCEDQSALFLACTYGHLNIVNYLLDHTSWLMNIIDDAACIHTAVSRGQTGMDNSSHFCYLFIYFLLGQQGNLAFWPKSQTSPYTHNYNTLYNRQCTACHFI